MTSPRITLDDTHWPLLILEFVGSPSVEQCREFFARRTAYLAREELHIGISDTSQMKLPPPEFRPMQAEWLVRHEAVLARTFLGTASIIRAPDILLLKSAAAFRSPLPYPTINVTDMRAAVSWSVGRLEAAGLVEPAARLRRSFALDGTCAPG